MEIKNPYQPPDASTPVDSRRSHRSTRVVGAVAGWTAVICFIGSTIGTVISMMSTFNSIAIDGDLQSTASLSGTISGQMLIGILLIPIGFLALCVWLACWWQMRRTTAD